MSDRNNGAALVAEAVAAPCGCVSLLGAEAREGRVVYLEDFDYYADIATCFRLGTRCVEWATGSLKGLGFTPEADGFPPGCAGQSGAGTCMLS